MTRQTNSFDPTLAALRFGTGLSPLFARPENQGDLLAEFDTPMPYRVVGFDQADPSLRDFQQAASRRNKARGTDDATTTENAFRDVRVAANVIYNNALRATFANHVGARVGFAARMERFWADHFTVRARNTAQRHLVSPFIADAIAPHMNGSFRDMLRAVVTHPMMLLYLQQVQSVGPQSPFGKRRKRGINENLARELLELHTLGVNGPYDQNDVRALAELLTGLTYNNQRGFFYDLRFAQPGAETVMDITYDAADGLANVLRAVDDLADHPQTAVHIAGKIAAYFVSDTPDADLIAAMAVAFRQSDGHLPAVYAAMLDHPSAWHRDLQKVKSPQHFMASALRALGLTGDAIANATGRHTREILVSPMRVMGQPWQRPNGPDGWPDDSRDWVSPQGMAGRINWAMRAPRVMLDARLPDPRDFVHTALGDLATQDVIFAAGAAEVRDEGIGLVLSAPAFQRS